MGILLTKLVAENYHKRVMFRIEKSTEHNYIVMRDARSKWMFIAMVSGGQAIQYTCLDIKIIQFHIRYIISRMQLNSTNLNLKHTYQIVKLNSFAIFK